MLRKNELLLTLCLLFSLDVHSQELIIKDMEETSDLSASLARRSDPAGEFCGLVKVRFSNPGTVFEGEVVPPIGFKTGEYWVYMSKGAEYLRIMQPGFQPLEVHFDKYGINQGIQPLTTYILTLSMPKGAIAIHSQTLTISYKPNHAILIVDSKPYKASGKIELSLPLGTHTYKIFAPGYKTVTGTVKLDANTPKVITEKLTVPLFVKY